MNDELEQLTMEGILDAFGIKAAATDPADPDKPADEQADDVTNPENPEEADQGETNPEPPAGGQQNPAEDDKELPLESLNKQAHAFAEMRKKLSEQNKVIESFGKALGITGKTEDILQGLQKLTNEKVAKDSGIPVEVLKRLEDLEAEKAAREANDKKIQTYAAINNFQRAMNLDQKQLNSFLVQLAKAGKNPFESNIDLKSEYLVMNFDRLQKEAIQKALEEQAKLDNKAAQQSTNPGSKNGGGDHKTTEVKTLDDLEAFLKTNIK